MWETNKEAIRFQNNENSKDVLRTLPNNYTIFTKKPLSWMFYTVVTQPAIKCSKSPIETLEQRVKHVQS